MSLNIASLALRLVFGLSMALAHGLPKLMSFSEQSSGFVDPFNVGPVYSMAFAVFAEFFCSLLVAFGAVTRLAALPPLVVMGVAFFKIHAGMAWDSHEASALFGTAFLAIALIGPGQFSFDYLVFKKK